MESFAGHGSTSWSGSPRGPGAHVDQTVWQQSRVEIAEALAGELLGRLGATKDLATFQTFGVLPPRRGGMPPNNWRAYAR